MARSYAKHGLVALSKRAKKRRHGPADMRTLEGRMGEQVRIGTLVDKGGEDEVSTLMLLAIEILKGEVATLAAINKGIKAYLHKFPKTRDNPRGLATLHGYRAPQVKTILKCIEVIGIAKVPTPAKTIHDLLAEDKAKTEHNGQDEAVTSPDSTVEPATAPLSSVSLACPAIEINGDGKGGSTD